MTDEATYAKAPPVTISVYDEAIPTLYMSSIAYTIYDALRKARNDILNLTIPEDFTITNLSRFLKESMDLTSPEFNNGNGMSFYELDALITANRDKLVAEGFDGRVLSTAVRYVREALASDDASSEIPMKKVFLTHYRSIQQDVACVYTVVKDTIAKRIIVSFRGSTDFSTRDWQTNFNAVPTALKTPKQIQGKMEGKLQDRVLVHRGIYQYLFDNSSIKGKQRFDGIVADIRNAINKEAGYSIYVTGHSLGGGLATMFSLKLAGLGKDYDDIPRPITCITWAALMSGTDGYRTAMEHLERDGLIRHARFTTGEDIVPAVPPVSLLRKRLMKHTGINFRLTSSGVHIEHTSRAGFVTAISNSMFKPIWSLTKWHSLALHLARVEEVAEKLKGMKLDDLYKDETIVSSDFIEGNVS